VDDAGTHALIAQETPVAETGIAPRLACAILGLATTTPTSACNIGSCSLLPCPSALTVQLTSPPSVPYRVEVYAVPNGPRLIWTCGNSATCGGIARFPDFRPERVGIEVIVASDTVRREVRGPIQYVKSNPNGRGCGPACESAALTLAP